MTKHKRIQNHAAGQPEQVSLNQCQLTAANSPELMLCACPTDGGDKVSL